MTERPETTDDETEILSPAIVGPDGRLLSDFAIYATLRATPWLIPPEVDRRALEYATAAYARPQSPFPSSWGDAPASAEQRAEWIADNVTRSIAHKNRRRLLDLMRKPEWLADLEGSG